MAKKLPFTFDATGSINVEAYKRYYTAIFCCDCARIATQL
jgi:hypothetical protein